MFGSFTEPFNCLQIFSFGYSTENSRPVKAKGTKLNKTSVTLASYLLLHPARKTGPDLWLKIATTAHGSYTGPTPNTRMEQTVLQVASREIWALRRLRRWRRSGTCIGSRRWWLRNVRHFRWSDRQRLRCGAVVSRCLPQTGIRRIIWTWTQPDEYHKTCTLQPMTFRILTIRHSYVTACYITITDGHTESVKLSSHHVLPFTLLLLSAVNFSHL